MPDPPRRLSSGADAGDDTRVNPDGRSYTGAPRWVKAFVIVFVVLVLVFVILHLTGNSLGGHGSLFEHGARRP